MVNKKGEMGEWIIMGFLVFLLFSLVSFSIYSSTYITPILKDNANKICQEEGYDFYEDYTWVGFFSSEPVAVRCKYAEGKSNMDIKLKQTFGDSN